MNNPAYTARLLEWGHQTLFDNHKNIFYLFIFLLFVLGYFPLSYVTLWILHVAPEFQELSKQTVISFVARRVANLKFSGAMTFLPFIKGFLNGSLRFTIIKEIEQNQLTWYGHVQRMSERRLPKIVLKWVPKQKRARGRPKKNWMEYIRKAMNERNLNEGQWEDRKQWSLGVGQHRNTFWNRYTYIQTYIRSQWALWRMASNRPSLRASSRFTRSTNVPKMFGYSTWREFRK